MRNMLKSGLARSRAKFAEALPIIAFFMFLFYTIVLFFGISYAILVSVVTILFKVNYRKHLTMRQLLTLIGTQFLMAMLAFFASQGLILCVLFNLAVPFLLVYLQASQFNQLGYFANAMCFTFLQLRPVVGWQGLAIQMGALAYGLLVLTAALLLCFPGNKKGNSFDSAQKGLILLAKAVRKRIGSEQDGTDNETDEIFLILHGLYNEAYKSRGLTYMVGPQGKIQYMFALLFQRAAYFLTSPYQAKMLKDDRCEELLSQLAQYMEDAGTGGLRQETLIERGNDLLSRTGDTDEAPYVFAQNFLRLFLIILESIPRADEQKAHPSRKRPAYRRAIKKIFGRMKTDTFETRFALRLSAVLTVGFVYSMVSQANHGYWFALISFLLLRPMYEDSVTRMKARFIGTAAGCMLIQILIPLFPGTAWHFLLATVMAAGLYMEAAGTWQQALFSTCFALTLTTMALPQTLAAELRILYVAAASILVLVVNRFFFRTSFKGQFRYNLQQLFHMHHVYLQMLEDSLNAPLDYEVISDAQIYYHMLHGQILEYLTKTGSENADFIRELLEISWFMVSEAEQMLFLINNRRTNELDAEQMKDYLTFTACIITDIQKMLHMKTDHADVIFELHIYKRSVKGEPRLSKLMEGYSKQVSRMYSCVCKSFRREDHA